MFFGDFRARWNQFTQIQIEYIGTMLGPTFAAVGSNLRKESLKGKKKQFLRPVLGRSRKPLTSEALKDGFRTSKPVIPRTGRQNILQN